MTFLLAIAIGPVQDFIRAGRKTRDLWYGSDLLARVARAAAQSLADHDAELIFPHPDALAGDVPIPNKLLALVPPDRDAATLANDARTAAQSVLDHDWTLVKGDPNQHIAGLLADWLVRQLDTDLAAKQIAGFLEWYAAWHPYDPATYRADRLTLERLLAGRKALRDFAQAPTSNRGRVPKKSSLDPGRDSVLDVKDARQEASVRSGLHLSRGEELDGVSLVKRLAVPKRFVSTARLAIEPFVQRAGAETLKPLCALAQEIADAAKAIGIDSPVERFEVEGNDLGHFAPFPFDTQLFWDPGGRDLARLLKDVKPGDRLDAKRDEIAALGKKMRAFFDQAQAMRKRQEPSIGEFPTYLAVLAADGDRMGAALSPIDDYRDHQAFSRRLTAFAEAARGIVAAHQGALVYSGGDDVLAFLPLHSALCCADALRRAFTATVNTDPTKPGVTLSVGIAIGHYSEHLDNLLTWARDAESAAKAGGRNALAVALHTRSGGQEAVPVVQSWTAAGGDPVGNRWVKWVEWHRRDAIPDGAAFDLRDLVLRLRDLPAAALTERRYDRERLPGFAQTRWSLLEAEVERVLRRKRAGHGSDALADEMIGAVLGFLVTDLGELDRLVRELLIARRLATAADVAYGEWTEGQDACKR